MSSSAQTRAGRSIGQNHTVIFAAAGTVTDSGTDVDQYFPAGGRFISNPFYRGMYLIVKRTADTGTCTLDVILQYYNWATNAFADCTAGGGAALGCVQYANDATGERVTRIYPGIIGGDADGVLIVNTVDKWYDFNMPPAFRLRVRSGGTTVTNTLSLVGLMLL